MSLITLDRIKQSLEAHAPKRHELRPTTRQAAVSVVLKPSIDHTEALFILRAIKKEDPWSGHMAFPGGHHEHHDESLRHTAERETHEEIGLDLVSQAEFIGQIDPVVANPRGRQIDMIVTPFVYELKQPNASFRPNYEVAEVLWGSLNDMHRGHTHTQGEFIVGSETVTYPGYSVGEQIVWGLTYRMLHQLFEVLDPNWNPEALRNQS